MDDRLEFNEAGFEAALRALGVANEALAEPAQDTAPTLTGVADVGARVSEFMTTMSVACGVMAAAATSVKHGVIACQASSDDVEQVVATAASAVVGAGSGAG